MGVGLFIYLLIRVSMAFSLAWSKLPPQHNSMNPYSYQPISHWAAEDRPREKLQQRGHTALTDAELLAILLGSGTRECSAIQLARTLIDESGGLEGLARCDVAALTRFKGIGPAKAITLIAAFELARRKQRHLPKRLKVQGAKTVADYLIPLLGEETQEVFYVLFLNRNHEVIAEKEFFRGGIAATVVDPRLIFREALQQMATAMIVAHNHPSGNLSPSQADLQITRKLAEGSKLFDLALLDHLIITSRHYYSFAEEGHL